MEKEIIEDPEFQKKIREVFEYFKPGKIFKTKSKSVSFYEYSSMIHFIKSLRNQNEHAAMSTGLKILEFKDDCLLLLSTKIVDSNFKICDDLDFASFNTFNSKLNHLRIYIEFLVGNEKGIKILRLYSDVNKAFYHARKKIKSCNSSEIQYQLYDGLDGEVIGVILEEIQESGNKNE